MSSTSTTTIGVARRSDRVIASSDGRQPPGKMYSRTKSVPFLARSKLRSSTVMACSAIRPRSWSSPAQVAKKVSCWRQSTASIISMETSLS